MKVGKFRYHESKQHERETQSELTITQVDAELAYKY